MGDHSTLLDHPACRGRAYSRPCLANPPPLGVCVIARRVHGPGVLPVDPGLLSSARQDNAPGRSGGHTPRAGSHGSGKASAPPAAGDGALARTRSGGPRSAWVNVSGLAGPRARRSPGRVVRAGALMGWIGQARLGSPLALTCTPLLIVVGSEVIPRGSRRPAVGGSRPRERSATGQPAWV
jgi:hypothetical protein